MGSYSIQSSVSMRAQNFLNSIVIKKTQSMEQIEQTEQVGSLWQFLHDLQYTT